jgi:hypothetical protein
MHIWEWHPFPELNKQEARGSAAPDKRGVARD